MREIRFRVWMGQKMILWEELLAAHNLAAVLAGEFGPVMQYTGIVDSNGRPIYEDDIIDYDQHRRTTAWENTTRERKRVRWTYDRWNIFEAGESGIEVVGNIYETPKLLSGPLKRQYMT